MPLAQRGDKGETTMKQIALAFVLAYAFTTGMAILTVVAHTDQAIADSATAAVAYPEQSVRM
jgi:hypothetical protein